MQFLSLKAQTSVFACSVHRSPGKFLNEQIFFNCVTCLQGSVRANSITVLLTQVRKKFFIVSALEWIV